MRYFVQLDAQKEGEPLVVDVTELPTGELDVSVAGRKIPVDVVPLAGSISVRVAGRMVDLTTEGHPPEIGAIVSGHRAYVRVESERQRAAAAARKGSAGAGDKVVKAPMPGRVVRVLVQKGAELEPGQTLCVIEAMKMENEIKAKAAGVVAEAHVVEGTAVEASAKLFTLA